MFQNKQLFLFMALSLVLCFTATPAHAQGEFDECIVSVLNRTAQVKPDGTWSIQNVPIPAEGLKVRARYTCTKDGITQRAQSEFITLTPNITNGFEASFEFGSFTPIPTRILLTAPTSVLTAIGDTVQLAATATLPDGSTADVTNTSTGTSYRCTTPTVASITDDGLITALTSGNCLFIAQHEGRTATFIVTITLGGDSDGDGIPDDVELDLGLDPNNPIDAGEDPDGDGLTNKEEATVHMTDPFSADSDGDGVNDGTEVGDETDPNNPNSVNFTGKGLLQTIEVNPNPVTLRTNTIIPQEISRQLQVLATLANNNVVDITSEGTGTTYFSNSLSVVSFGDDDGRLFAGNAGTTTVDVSNDGVTVSVPVEVTSFTPTVLSFLLIPGAANNCDVEGSYCYVAAGSTGLQVVDVSDPMLPSIVASKDTAGIANDVKYACGNVFIADGTNGLVVIDATDPLAPGAPVSFDTPGTAYDLQVCGDFAFIADGPSGLCIVDISDPTDMQMVGEIGVSGTTYGVDCDLVNNVVCVTGTSGFHVIDITNIATPVEVGMLTPTQLGSSSGGTDLVVRGVNVLVTTGGSSGNLASVDISTKNAPVKTGETPGPSSLTDVATDEVGLALCSDIISVNAVHMFNVTTPSSPVPAGLFAFNVAPTGNRDDNGTGIDVQQGLVYMTGVQGGQHSSNSNGGLHIGRYLEISDDLGVAPTVDLTAPSDGDSFIEGTSIPVAATADDDIGVSRVEFLRNGEVVGVDNAAPYETLMAAPVGVSNFQIAARAVDFAGNVSNTESITVNVTPDPLTTVVGDVIDPEGNPVEGASVRAPGVPTPVLTNPAGSFSIPDVPTILPNPVVTVEVEIGGILHVGASPVLDMVPAGVTDAGTIQVFPPVLGGFVDSPTSNRADWEAAVALVGGVINSNVNFDTHPVGGLNSTHYSTSDGVVLLASGDNNFVSFGAGPGQGNTGSQPKSSGEGLHAPSNYLSDGGGVSSLVINFDPPVLAAGLFTIDHFNPTGSNLLEIEAFTGPNGTGTSLGKFRSVAFNFQRNFKYFMGFASNQNNIGSFVYRDLTTATGDTMGLDDICFARR